ncbi:hypothetical protein LAD77_01730 [Klebsiella pneumoniae]|nr:hypothetical protein [Klebsiella pneumoniae]
MILLDLANPRVISKVAKAGPNKDEGPKNIAECSMLRPRYEQMFQQPVTASRVNTRYDDSQMKRPPA